MSNGKPCQSDWQWHQHSFGDRQQIMLWTYTNTSTTKGMEYASTKAIAHSAASNLAVEDLGVSNLAVVELAAFDSVVGDLVASDSVVSEASNSGVVDLATFNLPSQMIHN